MGRIIEISKKDSVAGRANVKFVLHEIYNNDTEFNKNGISWQQPYVEQNSHTVRGMPLVTQFLDDEKTIPFGGHGEMNVSEGIVTFENSLVVGSFENAYIGEVEVNNKKINALIGEAYVYEQRFPHLVEYMREEFENGRAVESSIEICAKKADGNDQIIYATGYKPQGRIPENYDYSGHAILIGQTPSDDSALMIELNHYKEENKIVDDIPIEVPNLPDISIEQNAINIIIEDEVKEELSKQVKEKVIVKSKSFEINELSYDDIATIISRAFNAAMSMKEPNEYCYYYMYKFYPQSQTIIMTDYNTPSEYYKTSYNITNNDVTIGDIVEVEQAWTPLNDEPSVEVNSSLIKDILSKKKDKGGKEKMDEKQIAEINAKLDDLTARLTDSDSKIVESNTKIDELNSTVTELNSTIVEANKTIEAKATELNSMTEELNSLKAFKEAKDIEAQEAEAQARIAEINTYFEVEIKKNGFSEVELNTLKTEYVEKNDMEGLKAKEAELCVKRVKELNSLKTNVENVELNSKQDNNDLFMAIHNTEKSEEDISDLF